MLVDEGFLHAEETVGAMAGPRRAHVEHAPFGYVDMVDIIGKRQAIFDIGRLEGGVALDERNTADEGLRCHEAAIRSEERRVGKECVRTCRSRWSPYN